MSAELSIYENAKHWVAQYESVDEVKQYIDKAAAVQEYARRANDYELEHQAARARVRAERRCGELLQEVEKAKGGQPYQSNGATSSEPAPTLSDMGLTKDQSSKFQQLANVPEAEFEKALEVTPNTHAILKARKAPEETKRIDETALYFWGRLIDFEHKLLGRNVRELVAEMTPAMRSDAERIIPLFAEWLGEFE